MCSLDFWSISKAQDWLENSDHHSIPLSSLDFIYRLYQTTHTWSILLQYLTELLPNHALILWSQVSLWNQKEVVLLNLSPDILYSKCYWRNHSQHFPKRLFFWGSHRGTLFEKSVLRKGFNVVFSYTHFALFHFVCLLQQTQSQIHDPVITAMGPKDMKFQAFFFFFFLVWTFNSGLHFRPKRLGPKVRFPKSAF